MPHDFVPDDSLIRARIYALCEMVDFLEHKLLQVEKEIGSEAFDAAMIAYYQLRRDWNHDLLRD